MEVDMRSSDPAALAALDAQIQAAVDAGVADENRRWKSKARITVTRELVGDRPAGTVADGCADRADGAGCRPGPLRRQRAVERGVDRREPPAQLEHPGDHHRRRRRRRRCPCDDRIVQRHRFLEGHPERGARHDRPGSEIVERLNRQPRPYPCLSRGTARDRPRAAVPAWRRADADADQGTSSVHGADHGPFDRRGSGQRGRNEIQDRRGPEVGGQAADPGRRPEIAARRPSPGVPTRDRLTSLSKNTWI